MKYKIEEDLGNNRFVIKGSFKDLQIDSLVLIDDGCKEFAALVLTRGIDGQAVVKRI